MYNPKMADKVNVKSSLLFSRPSDGQENEQKAAEVLSRLAAGESPEGIVLSDCQVTIATTSPTTARLAICGWMVGPDFEFDSAAYGKEAYFQRWQEKFAPTRAWTQSAC